MGHVRTQNIWKCDGCGEESVWGTNWRSKLILHNSKVTGQWDEVLVACSAKCEKSIDEKNKRKPRTKKNDDEIRRG